jgi:Rieske Fe-S protein
VSETTRRGVLAGAAGISATVALSACTKKDESPSTGSSGPTTNSSSSAAGSALAAVADIPVGGGKVFANEKVVVTQPTAGDIKAFSAVCTHQGCTVAQVADGLIACRCHGSRFKAADGSVANGPATKPLAAAKVTVADGKITLG